jgi:UDPglucose--hexose-1-phosphate uridylyltransferase
MSVNSESSPAGPHQVAPGMWEERWHPLREEWVIVAAHRQNRPWIGQTVGGKPVSIPAYVEDCYLCPGNKRVSGRVNPDYSSVFVFDNDHPCVGPDAPLELKAPPGLYRNRPANGAARVVCYNPRHDMTMAQMTAGQIAGVVQVWQEQTLDLGNRPEVNHVLCFENKGEVVGVSNPHPHGQIYATNFVFKTIETELLAARRYQSESDAGQYLFQDIIRAEQTEGSRILYEDDYSIAFLPYFARYAYEVYVAPKRTVPHIYRLDEREVQSLALALKSVTVRLDNLWQMSFPYVMALHQAPTDGANYDFHHFFIGFLPPLRQPNLLKYLAGPEIGGGNFLSDTSPEAKAAELKTVSDSVHYLETL